MAVKATDTITLAVAVDVQKVETYYYQTVSTGSQPSKPNTASPSGWQTTEFSFDSSKAIWSCQKTTLTDGTFFWGEVSKASAYEGAVVSYNEAQSAKKVATSYIFKTTGHDAWVCDEDAGPDPSTGEAYGPSATSPTTGWRIGDVFEMVRQGVSWFKLWVESNAAKLRLGRDDSGHVVLGDDGMEVFADGTSMAEFGGRGARIGASDGLHQVLTGESTSFMYGDDAVAYVSTDKFYAMNAEVEDAFYIGDYSIRNASDGSLVIGLRR